MINIEEEMNAFNKKLAKDIGYTFLGIITISIIIFSISIYLNNIYVEEYCNTIYKEGQKAAEIGIDPSANPLVRHEKYARVWLKGYMDYIENGTN